MQKALIIDSHTGGEPTRLVIEGGPALGDGTLAQRLANFRRSFDAWRAGVVTEPRGSDVVVGGLLCRPDATPEAAGCAAAVIFFNNVGYLGMCGHGTIGLVVSLAHKGLIGPGAHRIQTPAGVVRATLHEDMRVSVENVPARRLHKDVAVEVPGHGLVTGDVAWGGNWFFLVADHGFELVPRHIPALTAFTEATRLALARAGIAGEGGAEIDHIELFSDSPAGADSRSFVLCPGGAYDRSPCGTGTSAKLACLAADGLLAPGQAWRQESIIGSVFEARYAAGDQPGFVLPTITGSAHITGEGTLYFDAADPFAWGIPLR